MVVVEVGHATDVAQHVGDLSGDALQLEDVPPVELDGELALHSGQGLVHVVLDRLREVRGDAGDVREASAHLLDQSLLVADSPLAARLEADVELGGVGAIDVGAVVRRPSWETTTRTSGKVSSRSRMSWTYGLASSSEMPMGNFTPSQMSPSSSSGRNSLPRSVNATSASANIAAVAPTGTAGRRRQKRSAGR